MRPAVRRDPPHRIRAAAMVLLVCCSVASQASEIVFGAYVGLPFGREAPVVGVGLVPGFQRAAGQTPLPSGDGREAGLHLRFGGAGGTALSLNGVPLARVTQHYQDAGASAAAQQGVDWYLVAGVVLGAGLIYAIADADDVTISGCSGPNCPPAEKPPAKPEPEPGEPEGGAP